MYLTKMWIWNKELSQLINSKLNNNQINMDKYFTKEYIQITNEHMKRCLMSLVIRKMQMKTTINYHYSTQ